MAEFTPQQVTWLERYMRLLVDRQVQTSTSLIVSAANPVGTWQIVPDDLTANASEYVYTHPVTGLTFLYCNGAAVSQTTYATLYALWGASKWATDSGGNFYLPDARGRSLWLAGTNTNTDVGDTDGVAEASREPKHVHTSSSLTVTGAPAITDPGHTHQEFTYLTQTGGNTSYKVPAIGIDPQGAQQDFTDSGGNSAIYMDSATTGITSGLGTLDVGGTAGSGMSGSDAVAHLVLGSLVVRF